MRKYALIVLVISLCMILPDTLPAQKKPKTPPPPPPAAQEPAPEPPQSGIRDKKGNSIEPEVILVPAGTFMMGNDGSESNEKPVHEVTMHAYYIGKYEITNRQYKAFIELTGLKSPTTWEDGNFPEQVADHPVTGIAWEDAYAYCDWLSDFSKKKYRLPTEAEWERAARGGLAGMKFPWGNDINKLRANYGKNYSEGTTPAGKIKPNEFGICDMAGNAAEWVADWYSDEYYGQSPKEDPKGPDSGSKKVVRGGSWRDDPEDIRVSVRKDENPTSASEYIGFRVVREK
jgi:formylglycine-generating enzyme required for sulfatase activity